VFESSRDTSSRTASPFDELHDYPHIGEDNPPPFSAEEDTSIRRACAPPFPGPRARQHRLAHSGIRNGYQLMGFNTSGGLYGWSRFLNYTEDIPNLENTKPFFVYISSCSILNFLPHRRHDFERFLTMGGAGAVGLVAPRAGHTAARSWTSIPSRRARTGTGGFCGGLVHVLQGSMRSMGRPSTRPNATTWT